MASRASKAKRASQKTKALKARIANRVSSTRNAQGGRDFSINLSETLKFGDKASAKLPSRSGSSKRSLALSRGKSSKFFLKSSQITIRKSSNTPEQQAFASANLQTQLNRKVGKSFVFKPKTVTLPVEPQFTQKKNAQGGTDFSINLNERLTFADKPISGVLTIPPTTTNGLPPDAEPFDPVGDFLDIIRNFFGGGGSKESPQESQAGDISIQFAPATLPEISDDETILFPPTTSQLGSNGETEQTDKGFLDSLIEKPENLVLAGTAIVGLIAGLK